jgi:hypothetical protein
MIRFLICLFPALVCAFLFKRYPEIQDETKQPGDLKLMKR